MRSERREYNTAVVGLLGKLAAPTAKMVAGTTVFAIDMSQWFGNAVQLGVAKIDPVLWQQSQRLTEVNNGYNLASASIGLAIATTGLWGFWKNLKTNFPLREAYLTTSMPPDIYSVRYPVAEADYIASGVQESFDQVQALQAVNEQGLRRPDHATMNLT